SEFELEIAVGRDADLSRIDTELRAVIQNAIADWRAPVASATSHVLRAMIPRVAAAIGLYGAARLGLPIDGPAFIGRQAFSLVSGAVTGVSQHRIAVENELVKNDRLRDPQAEGTTLTATLPRGERVRLEFGVGTRAEWTQYLADAKLSGLKAGDGWRLLHREPHTVRYEIGASPNDHHADPDTLLRGA